MNEIESQLTLFVERHCIPGRTSFKEFSRLFFGETLLPGGDAVMPKRQLSRALEKRGLLIAGGFFVALTVR